MILKAIFEFKLLGSSASVALSIITSVSRNQGKWLQVDSLHFRYSIVYCFSNKVLGLVGLYSVCATLFPFLFFNISLA